VACETFNDVRELHCTQCTGRPTYLLREARDEPVERGREALSFEKIDLDEHAFKFHV
jgi:hypothetical protein